MYVNFSSHIHFDDFISMLMSREKEMSSYVKGWRLLEGKEEIFKKEVRLLDWK